MVSEWRCGSDWWSLRYPRSELELLLLCCGSNRSATRSIQCRSRDSTSASLRRQMSSSSASSSSDTSGLSRFLASPDCLLLRLLLLAQAPNGDAGDEAAACDTPHLANAEGDACRHTSSEDVVADPVTHKAASDTVVAAEQLEDDTDTLGTSDVTNGDNDGGGTTGAAATVDVEPFAKKRSTEDDTVAEDVVVGDDAVAEDTVAADDAVAEDVVVADDAVAEDVVVAVNVADGDERHEADEKQTAAARADDCGLGEAGGEETGRDSVVVVAEAAATTSSTSRRSRLRASAAVSPCRCCCGSSSRERLKPESGGTASTSSPDTRLATLSGRPSAPPESLMTLSGEHGADEAESLDDRHDSPLLVATLSVLAARS